MKRKQLIRQKFRDAVFKRDGHKCRFCDETKDLDAHHITDRNEMPNGGYVLENGITLCQRHHYIAEKYHISQGKHWEPGFKPDELYKLIGSSHDLALEKDKKNGN